jgi:hypothetical protein
LHLGYAFEFSQPAIVAEGLAMASVHDPDYEKMGPIFIQAEALAGEPGKRGDQSLRELLEAAREDARLTSSMDGENKIDRSKNVADHAQSPIAEYAAQYTLSEDQLTERVNEMVDTCGTIHLFSAVYADADRENSAHDRNEAETN